MSKVQEASLKDLHPTQLTVGLIVVQDKKKHLAALSPAAQRGFMKAHPMPAVIGAQGRLYITDHHHLGRAAFDAGVTCGFFQVDADLSKCTVEAFWKEMNESQWVHPLDEHGVRHYYATIPDHLGKLVDDVYRSLAGYVRDAGGYDKTPTAFAEFIWADFFRRNIPIETVHADFPTAVRAGISLAQSKWARNIPGFNAK
ncbi:MAG: ParB-like protein [Steroidobacteraceae bacterium]